MPSTSKKQHNLMAMVANDPAAAKRLGIPQSVGKDFVKADVGRSFKEGGDMKKGYAGGGMTMVKKGGKMVPDFAADGKGKMAKGGMATAAPKKMMGGGMAYAKGGVATSLKAHAGMPASKAHAGLKGGGFVKAADGVATKGKTKATQIKMKSGGMC